MRGARVAIVLGLVAGFGACEGASSDGDQEPASPDGGYVYVRDAAPLPSAAPVVCDGNACSEVIPGALAAGACCLDGGGCGLETLYAAHACFTPHQPGHPELSCPALSVPGGPLLQGCCTPSGTCGVLDRFGDIGCVPLDEPGRDTVSCVYQEGADCRQIAEAYCDGAEDCGPGLQCCGRVATDLYDAFACFPSCRDVVDGFNGVWVALCHVGQGCAETGERCAVTPELPAPYARCYVGGEEDVADVVPAAEPGVRCGSDTCAAGEKCCFRPPLDPYCSPVLTPCGCSRRDADAGDASASVDGAF